MSTKAMTTLSSILIDLGIPQHSINDQARLRTDLQVDSTEIVEIVLELKRHLQINIKLESRKDMSLSDICMMIDRAMAAPSPDIMCQQVQNQAS
jgi:acyl carrier protein